MSVHTKANRRRGTGPIEEIAFEEEIKICSALFFLFYTFCIGDNLTKGLIYQVQVRLEYRL